MGRYLLILPLAALALIGCNRGNDQTSSNGSSYTTAQGPTPNGAAQNPNDNAQTSNNPSTNGAPATNSTGTATDQSGQASGAPGSTP